MPPQRLVLGLLLSSEWIITSVFLVVAVIATVVFQVVQVAISALIPLGIGVVTMVSRRVISMFNFTLAESPRGLRITRGLTNLTSQSVPINRLQGVRVSQPLLWKSVGWYRVDVDVIGYAGSGDGENNESQATNVLLPVATRDEVDLALSRALPGFDLDGIELHPVPRRARWLRWFDWWTLRYGWDERALITEHGWMIHSRDIVPHAKTQSVRIVQGPWQRRLRLADVHIDTPKGPVNLVAHQLDAGVARELTLTQLDRARPPGPPTGSIGPSTKLSRTTPARTRCWPVRHQPRPAARGRWGDEVFALDPPPRGLGGSSTRDQTQRVLRLYRADMERQPTISQLRALYGSWAQADIGIEVPLILDSGVRDGRTYTIDRRFSGRPFSGWLATAERTERRDALGTFLDAVSRLWRLPSPLPGFARLVGADAPRSSAPWVSWLRNMLARPTQTSREHLTATCPTSPKSGTGSNGTWPSGSWIRCWCTATSARPMPMSRWVRTGPWSPVSATSAPTRARGFHDGRDGGGGLSRARALRRRRRCSMAGGLAVERFGPDTAHWIDVYRRFYGFYFSDAGDFDPALYGWCLRQLNRTSGRNRGRFRGPSRSGRDGIPLRSRVMGGQRAGQRRPAAVGGRRLEPAWNRHSTSRC